MEDLKEAFAPGGVLLLEFANSTPLGHFVLAATVALVCGGVSRSIFLLLFTRLNSDKSDILKVIRLNFWLNIFFGIGNSKL